VIKKEDEVLNYKDLIIEIQRVWKVKAKMISVITGATGTVSESHRQYLSNTPGKHGIKKKTKEDSLLYTAYTYCCKC
jgi:hypothetical protein